MSIPRTSPEASFGMRSFPGARRKIHDARTGYLCGACAQMRMESCGPTYESEQASCWNPMGNCTLYGHDSIQILTTCKKMAGFLLEAVKGIDGDLLAAATRCLQGTITEAATYVLLEDKPARCSGYKDQQR